ncbi:MAG: hypothetical protein RLZZ470_649 [Pseudomonadota bacterium]|jgi:hypothetical protein
MTLRFSLTAVCVSMWCISLAQAACIPNEPLTRPDSRYQAVDAKGAEVKDLETGLVWQRCVHGQQWDGQSCTGDPVAQDWNTAAKAVAGTGWRLPTQKELQSLSETSCAELALNQTWFGSGPSGWVWTSTDMGSPDGAVVVHSGSSLIANLVKKLPLFVRRVQ